LSLPNRANIQQAYTDEARRLAARSMTGLAQTRLTPTTLTVSGALLCVVGSVVVHFQYRDHLLYYWLGAAIFVVGSVLDVLDGALARAGGKTTPFGGFIDSTTDRIGEAFMLASIGLIFAREGNETALAFTFAALAGGTFLVSYTRARAEALGLRGDIGLASRAERVALIAVGLLVAPWGGLQWAIYAVAATAWLTVAQRVWSVRMQLAQRDGKS
jgi:CDP-diacylglycerol--glycerol-3-phosphate 3-phosphatidyltransferase